MRIVINLNPQQQALIAAHPGRAVIVLSEDLAEWAFNVLTWFPQDSDFMFYEVPIVASEQIGAMSIAVGSEIQKPQDIAVREGDPGRTRTSNQLIKS